MPITNAHMADQYAALHKLKKFHGYGVLKHADLIEKLCKEINAETLLDYGCGRAKAYNDGVLATQWGVAITKHDPYHPSFASRPEGRFDVVLCMDVMEHVPEEDAADVLADLVAYAKKLLFLTIALKPARKTLPDGRNAHVTLKPKDWWRDKISDVMRSRQDLDVYIVFVED